MNRKIFGTAANIILTYQREWLNLVLDLDLISTKEQQTNVQTNNSYFQNIFGFGECQALVFYKYEKYRNFLLKLKKAFHHL